MTPHPEPRTTEEWLIDIYAKLDTVAGHIAELPCRDHTERISNVERWQGNIQSNGRVLLAILAGLTTTAGLVLAAWRLIWP